MMYVVYTLKLIELYKKVSEGEMWTHVRKYVGICIVVWVHMHVFMYLIYVSIIYLPFISVNNLPHFIHNCSLAFGKTQS